MLLQSTLAGSAPMIEVRDGLVGKVSPFCATGPRPLGAVDVDIRLSAQARPQYLAKPPNRGEGLKLYFVLTFNGDFNGSKLFISLSGTTRNLVTLPISRRSAEPQPLRSPPALSKYVLKGSYE